MALPSLTIVNSNLKTFNELSGLTATPILIKFTPSLTEQYRFKATPFDVLDLSLGSAVTFQLLDADGQVLPTMSLGSYIASSNSLLSGNDYYLKVTSTTPYSNVIVGSSDGWNTWGGYSKNKVAITNQSGFTQAQLDAAVSAAVSNATTGLFTQSQLDSAVASALAGVSSNSSDLTSVLANLAGVDISSSGSVAFSKTKADYVGFDSDKKIIGNLLANKITTGVNSTTVSGGDGNDTIDGGIGNDSVDGGKGDDTINAGLGNNKITAGDGNDTVSAGLDNDTIDGGIGNDIINAGDGNNSIVGGVGLDSITSGSGNDKIDGGTENDTINAGDGLNTITGGKGADSITSGFGNDKIDGGDDNDTISAGDGNNTVLGGTGADSITAGIGSDSINGGAGDDTINGGDGNDKISGDAGIDRLVAGLGNDTLTGGADADLFVFSVTDGLKTITDFKSTVDKLVLTDSLTPTALDATHFVTSATNSFTFTASDSYGFNTKTGALFYDADGAAGVDAVQIALIANKAPLVASDIFV